MNKTNFLKSVCKEILKNYCNNTYLGQCPAGEFPRIEYELRQLNTDDNYYKYILTLNLYDKNTSATIDDIADCVCDEIGLALLDNKKYFIKIYKQNDRQKINESDKSIQHIMLSFEIRLYERNE